MKSVKSFIILFFCGILLCFHTADAAEGEYDYILNQEPGPEIDTHTTEQLVSKSGKIYMKRDDQKYTLYGDGVIDESVIADYFKSVDYQCNVISSFTVTSDSKIVIERSSKDAISSNIFYMINQSGRYIRQHYYVRGDKYGDPIIHKSKTVLNEKFSANSVITLKNVEFSSAAYLFAHCASLSKITFDHVTFADTDASEMFISSKFHSLDLSGIDSQLIFHNSFNNSLRELKLNQNADTSDEEWFSNQLVSRDIGKSPFSLKIIDATLCDGNIILPDIYKDVCWTSSKDETKVSYGNNIVEGNSVYEMRNDVAASINITYPYDKIRHINVNRLDTGRKYEIPSVDYRGYTFVGPSTNATRMEKDDRVKIFEEDGKWYLQLLKPQTGNGLHFVLYYTKNTYKLQIIDPLDSNNNYAANAIMDSNGVIPWVTHKGYTTDGIFESLDYSDSLLYYTGEDSSRFKFTFAKDTTLYYKFTPIKYKLIYHYPDGPGQNYQLVNPDEQQSHFNWGDSSFWYTITDDFALTTISKEGYTFDGWCTDESLSEPITKITPGMTGDLDLYAKATPITAGVTFELNGGTVSDVMPTEATTDETVNIPEPTKAGAEFDGWYYEPSFTAASKITDKWLITGDTKVYAKWTKLAECMHENTITKDKVEPNCAQDGYSGDVYCADCDKLISVGHVIAKNTNHGDLEVRNKQDATCTQTGYTGDKYCTLCNELVEKGTEIARTEHTWSAPEIIQKATSETEGEVKYVCTACGTEKTVTIPKNTCKHETTEIKNYKAATCNEFGYSGDIYCVNCEELVENGHETEKSGTHGKAELRNVKTVTAIDNGYSGDLYCTVCNELLMEGYTIQSISPVITSQIELQKYDLSSTKADPVVYNETPSGEYKPVATTSLNNVRTMKLTDNQLSITLKNGSPSVKIQVSRKKDMSNAKTYKVQKKKAAIKGLKHKTYYIRIKTNEHNWSKVKKIKAK